MVRYLGLTSSLVVISFIGTAFAQEIESQLSCDTRWLRRANDAYCEIRELDVAADGALSIEAGGSGSVYVTGWNGEDVRVRAQVVAWERDRDSAQEIVNSIEIETDDVLRARYSDRRTRPGAVSFEIRAPRETDLQVRAANGTIAITDIHGELDVKATNGRVELSEVSNRIAASATNGSVAVAIATRPFDGESIDIGTTNGAVTLSVPADFSANYDVRTINGGIRVGFPMNERGPRAHNWLDASLGSGGPTVRIRTTNGGVRITD